MYIKPQFFTLKDGRAAILRCAGSEEAAEVLALMRQTAAETDHLLRCPEEWETMTEQDEALYLLSQLGDDYALQLVCEVEGNIVGTCNISRHRLRKVCHRGDVGLCILQEYWGLGIGKAMFAALTAQAERWGLSQLELEVVDINERGIALYRKLGFEVYGERPDGVILPDGRALKDLLMVKKL